MEREYDTWHLHVSFRHTFSLRVYVPQFQWRLLIFNGKKTYDGECSQKPKKYFSKYMNKSYLSDLEQQSENQIKS